MRPLPPRLLMALSLAASVYASFTAAQAAPADQQPPPRVYPSDDDFDDVASVDGAENADVELLGARVLALRMRIPELEPGYVEGIIFGAPGAESIEAARLKLGFMAQIRIDSIDLACGLNPGQQRTLRVAGEGDIKRLFDRIEEFQYRARPKQGALSQEFMRDAIEFRNMIAVGPFGGQSLFNRMLDRMLTAEQRARCAEFGGTDRLGAAVRIRTWPNTPDKVKEIWLSGTTFGDDGLERLKPLTCLQRLHLDSTRITDAGLVHLAELTNLEDIDLSHTRMQGSGLVHFRQMQSLKTLNLGHTQTNDESLAHVGRLSSLKMLKLDNSLVTSRGLASLGLLTQLENLSLCETQVADEGLADLSTLKNLCELDLGATQITDAGLAHLRDLTHLRVLDLRRTRVSDAGLVHLKELPGLKYVYLYGTQVTEVGITALNRSSPSAKVVR